MSEDKKYNRNRDNQSNTQNLTFNVALDEQEDKITPVEVTAFNEGKDILGEDTNEISVLDTDKLVEEINDANPIEQTSVFSSDLVKDDEMGKKEVEKTEKAKKEKKPLFGGKKKEKKEKMQESEVETTEAHPKKKKSYAWVFMLILLFAQLALYGVVVYGGYDGFIRIAIFAAAIFAAIINLFVIFNSR